MFAATVFGQNLRLEPLETEKRAMWKREMNCLLSVCDYIVEFIPRCQSLSNGATVEVTSLVNFICLQKTLRKKDENFLGCVFFPGNGE